MNRITAFIIAMLMFTASGIYSATMGEYYIRPNNIKEYSNEYFLYMWPSYVLFIGAFLIIVRLLDQIDAITGEQDEHDWTEYW